MAVTLTPEASVVTPIRKVLGDTNSANVMRYSGGHEAFDFGARGLGDLPDYHLYDTAPAESKGRWRYKVRDVKRDSGDTSAAEEFDFGTRGLYDLPGHHRNETPPAESKSLFVKHIQQISRYNQATISAPFICVLIHKILSQHCRFGNRIRAVR